MIRKYFLIIGVILVRGILNISQAQQIDRIVSLAPSLTKDIYYLKSNNKLVGCTSYCKEAKGTDIPVVASAIKVNIEKVISVKPDLVIATSITPPDVLETIKSFGIRVEVFPAPTSFDVLCKQFMDLARLIGKQNNGQIIIDYAKHKVDSLQKLFVWNQPPNIFFQIGAQPLYTVLSNTFMNDYIKFMNGKNIAEGFKFGAITRESVIGGNPNFIFIADMGNIGIEEKSTWLAFKEIEAVRNKGIHIIDSEIACTPTPITFIQTLEYLYKVTHP